MPITLHAATVPSMVQILGAAQTWLDKAAASQLSEDELCGARLIDDMLPFAYQVKSMAVHSAGAIEGVRKGVFSPDFAEPPTTLEGLRALLHDTIDRLRGVEEAELESWVGRAMHFEVPGRDMRLAFTAEDFLLSFSQPNFYFHASTAYDILRVKGIDIGKRDFLVGMRTRP